MTDRDSPPGFWQTIPGLLTAIAAVMTAAGSLYAVLRSTGNTTPPSPPAAIAPAATVTPPIAPVTPSAVIAAVPTTTPTSVSEQPKAYSEGRIVVRGTWEYDLDSGAQTTDDGRADFWWDQATNVQRFIAPKNGAQFAVVGIRDFGSIGYTDLKHFNYSPDKIDGSDSVANRIPVGTVVAYVTKEGRYGKFQVEQYGYNLSIQWVTFSSQ